MGFHTRITELSERKAIAWAGAMGHLLVPESYSIDIGYRVVRFRV